MTQTTFLTVEQVLIIHEVQIERYGGSFGLRNLPLLESAVYRPQSSFGGEDLYKTVFDKAAALLHSMLLNHPFVDGNKRTALVSGMTFLEFNGYSLRVAQNELIRFGLDIENKKMPLAEIAFWLKKHSKRLR